MWSRFLQSGSGGLAVTVAKAAAAIAFLSIIAANWLAVTTMNSGEPRADVVARARLPLSASDDIDPIVTGSLATPIRLDPCMAVAPAKR